jgi:hypothetical protein
MPGPLAFQLNVNSFCCSVGSASSLSLIHSHISSDRILAHSLAEDDDGMRQATSIAHSLCAGPISSMLGRRMRQEHKWSIGEQSSFVAFFKRPSP